jgi:hypothetical protein
MTEMVNIYIPPDAGGRENTDSITNHLNLLEQAANDGFEAIADVLGAASSVGITMEEYTPVEAGVSTPESPVGYTPYSDFSYATEEFLGEAPDLSGLDINLDLGSLPEMNFERPVFNIPAPPDVDWPTFTEDPPSVTALDLPSAPDVALPDPPTLEEIDIPAPPSAAVPEFSGTEPSLDLTPPDISFAWTEDQYASALLTSLIARLESELASGGQGYAASIEQAKYDREESRTMDEEDDAYLAALDDGVARGWRLPPGVVVGNLLKLSDKISQSREELNYKVLVEQTELAVQNSRFALSQAVKTESRIIDHHNNIQQRSFEAAKFALFSSMEIYKAKTEAYQAKVQAYAVLAKVYDAKIRAEIVKAEMYKAHIEGLAVGVAMNELKVERYKAQLKGIKSLVELYKAEMQAGRVLAEVEQTRMQGYVARVEAYRGRISAIQAQADAYIAQVRGEETKADMVKADANAYKAEMRAYEAQTQVLVEEARMAVETLRAKLVVYNAQVTKYSAEIDREVGLGKSSQRLRDAQARLRVLQARYEEATIDLDAALYNARTTERSAGHRAKAIMQESLHRASETVTEASQIHHRAASDADTAIVAAVHATNTTNVSNNTRMNSMQNSNSRTVVRVGNARTNATDVGYYDFYND